MEVSEREDQTSEADEDDVECCMVSKKIASVTLESDSNPETPKTAEERTVRRKKRTKRKGQQMDVDPTPKAKSDSKYMDCDGFESHISSSDESYSEDNKGREADDEQSDWVGYSPPRGVFESPFDRRYHVRRSQPAGHQSSSLQKKIERFAREGGRGELVLETRFRDGAANSLLQRYLYKYHLEVVRRQRGTITLRKKFEAPSTSSTR
ncbi:unnamed protein product [Caenorhabditis sp. 36 PRJEB53466]|nr:unnamed protein product [Caenorhabditis sp. 36 PRJEB53466]